MSHGVWLSLLLAAIRTLAPDHPVDGNLSPGKPEEFHVAAQSGEYLRVMVDGHGALLRLVVLDPDGHASGERVRSGGERTPMTWSAVSQREGIYRLQLSSLEHAAGTAHYRIAVVEQHPASDRDRLRVRAESALAVGEAEHAAQLAHQAKDPGAEAEACWQLSQSLFNAGKTKAAETRFEQANELWRTSNDSLNQARALRGLGKLYGDTQQAQKAVDTLQKALAMAEASGDPAGQAEALRELGSVAGARSDYAKAGELFERGLALARQAADRRTEADLLNMLGVLDQNTGKDSEARANYEASLALRRAIDDRAGLAQSTTNLGVFHRNLGEARTAVAYYQEALALRKQLGNAQGIAATMENLAVAQADLGNFDDSITLARQAADLFHSSQARRGEMFALISLGDVYGRLGEPQKALDEYARALAIARTIGERRGEAIALLSSGSIRASRQQIEQARTAYSDALRISREAGNQREIAHALFSLAELEASSDRAREAMDAAKNIGDRRGEARALSLLGNTLGDRSMLRGALAIQQEIVDPDQEALTRMRLAHVEEKAGDLEAARSQSLAALDLLERVRRNAPPEGPRISFQAYKQPFYQQAADILMAMHRRDPSGGFDAQALEVSERARARALLDQLAEGKVGFGVGVNAALAREVSRTLELLDAKADYLTRLLGGRHTGEQSTRARREVEELETRLAGLRERMRRECAACSGLIDPQPLSLEQMQREVLDDRTVLLEYMLGPSHGYVWAVTKTSLKVYDLPARAEIEKLVQRIFAELTDPAVTIENESTEGYRSRIAASQRAFEISVRTLSHMLVPVSGEIARKRVLVAADGPLYSLPFHTLFPRDTETVLIPSASSLAFLRRERGERATNSIALFADPDFAALPRLRLSRDEAVRVAALVPGEKKLALGPEATRSAVAGAALRHYSIVHFAAHALMDNERPELSGIALSDGMLRLPDIYNLSLNARLIVLSACSTAAGRQEAGEGPISLARAFLYAGAEGVVASLWDVNDRATEVFMTHFYEGLFKRNLSSDAALEFARAAMRSDPAWRHPYYWAGFVLVGDSARFPATRLQGYEPSNSRVPSRTP